MIAYALEVLGQKYIKVVIFLGWDEVIDVNQPSIWIEMPRNPKILDTERINGSEIFRPFCETHRHLLRDLKNVSKVRSCGRLEHPDVNNWFTLFLSPVVVGPSRVKWCPGRNKVYFSQNSKASLPWGPLLTVEIHRHPQGFTPVFDDSIHSLWRLHCLLPFIAVSAILRISSASTLILFGTCLVT